MQSCLPAAAAAIRSEESPVIAMTLMPDASYCEALARLAGLLADIPFVLEWHVPTEKVVTG